jgi:Domain of unknown function (DUF1905)
VTVTAHAFQAELWRYDGEAGWYFVSLPVELADSIRTEHGPLAKGFRSVKVHVRIGSSRWATSVFPDRARGTYLLPVKKSVRLAEGLDAGDTIPVELTVLD